MNLTWLALLFSFLPLVGLTWDGGGDGGGGGNGGGDGGEGKGAGGGTNPNPEVKYTQADVERLTKQVEDRISRKHAGEMKALQDKLSTLSSGEGLSEEQKAEIEQMRFDLMDEKGKLALTQKQAENKLREATEGKAKAESELTNYIVDSELMAAAIPKASGKDPSATAKLIVSVLKQNAKLDPATKKVTIEMEVVEAGVPIKKALSPAEAVANLETKVDQYGSLFKASAQSGFGGSNGSQGGGKDGNGLNFKGMSWEEFNKLAEDRPDLVGLPNGNLFGSSL